MRSRLMFCVLALVAITAGCAKTNMTNLWISPETEMKVGSILVVSLERNEDLRRLWEDALTSEFQANGVMARQAYSLFPTALPDSQQVGVVTRRDGYDGVAVMHRVSTSYTGRFEGGDYTKTAPGAADDYWRSWYHTHFSQASNSAPFDEGEARFQIDVANVAGRGHLIWTGTTVEIDPLDAEKYQREVCGELVTELVRRDLVSKRK